MKKVIKGRVYDSGTAKKMNMRFTGQELARTGWEDLYQKKSGEFFLLEHIYSGNIERITPMTYVEAQAWAEKYLSGDEYEEIFGEIVENDDPVQIHVSMTQAEAEIIKRNAAKEGMTVSAYIVMKCAE